MSCKDDDANTIKKGISDDLLFQFHLFAEYAAAAYAPINNNSTGTFITCSGNSCPGIKEQGGNCPQVEVAKARTLMEFQNTPRFDDTGMFSLCSRAFGKKLTSILGYIAIDPTNELVVLAFRGSASKQNWQEDIKMTRDPTPWCKDCHVHHGFWESWMEIKENVTQNVIKAIELYPNYRFVVVGHSLGAALATIAATDIRRESEWLMEHTELFSYGSPRIGNNNAVIYMSDQSTLSYRITASKDPIPRLPPVPFGYRHTSPEYWIKSNPLYPMPDEVRVLTGCYNSLGNSGENILIGLDEHRRYFGWMSGCDDHKDPSHKKAFMA